MSMNRNPGRMNASAKNTSQGPAMSAEQARLYRDIGIISFVVVEMTEYLDTHPTDKDAMEYISHYVKMQNQAMREYAMKYGPLRISDADGCNDREWKWATEPWPWEGVC